MFDWDEKRMVGHDEAETTKALEAVLFEFVFELG